jgi:hypothetical protein
MVWMHARSGVNLSGHRFCEGYRSLAIINTAACYDKTIHTRIIRAPYYLVTIVIETVVCQVCTNVDKVKRHSNSGLKSDASEKPVRQTTEKRRS